MRRYFRIAKWEQFQQYKDRDPKWIKVYRDLLDHYEFESLDESTQAHLIKIWLLAAKLDNRIPFDPSWVGRRIGAKSEVQLNQLCTAGFIEPYNSVQNCTDEKNNCTNLYLETERETEKEAERETEKEAAKNGFLSQFDDHAESVLSLARETLESGRFIPITKKQANKYAQFSADVADRSLDDWREYFELCNRQAWIDGKFKPTYGWLVSPDNVPEVEAGKYAGDSGSVDDTVAKLLQDTDAVVDAEWEVAS